MARGSTYVSINDPDDFRRRYILGEELGMSRPHTTITTNEDYLSADHQYKPKTLTVPSLISGDESKVLRLRLGTFSYTPRNSAFELVGSYDV